ncbi:PhlD [Streptomyces sp. TX20-6-3]|uniref:PhlD n=1 Tax=Streptomyces sp. TX20-6-3 TaxID=3028705 RepID=UPI0029A9E135|nr:PhlD [Streptomyces sp. TX20-6-3]MDX2565211.1 PhlD [Streptomyces sp. TX20-6-3]
MAAYVSTPSVILPDCEVSTAEIADDIQSHHGDHPRLLVAQRAIANCGVRTRYFSHPLKSPLVSGGASVSERTRAAFVSALEMSKKAARKALEVAGITVRDVDAIVTSHVTGWAVPNLDVHLIRALGLSPRVRRIPMTTLACAGGAQSLVRANDLVMARPHERVLVVVAEALSTSYLHADTTIPAMIYKALFGDGAAAAVVTGSPLTAGFRIDETYEAWLPGSIDRYQGRLSPAGLHFDSDREAPRSAGKAMPAVQEWLAGRDLDFPVIHPGAPGIIHEVASCLGFSDQDARHSYDSLSNNGNLGGPAVLDVLTRTASIPPTAGDHGLLIGFGPGFVTAALRGTWTM